jgi:DinB superfamily
MKVDPSEIEEALKLLEATPQRREAFSKGIDQTQLHFSSAEEPWSPNDILAHLCTCADVWGKSIMAMISQEHPILCYVSPRTWMRKTHYPEQDFHASLAAFSKQRSELLGVLKTPKKQ